MKGSSIFAQLRGVLDANAKPRPADVYELHCGLRDNIFRRISPVMNEFAEDNHDLKGMDLTRAGIDILVRRENEHVREKLAKISDASCAGDVLARATPAIVRCWAGHTLGENMARLKHGIFSALAGEKCSGYGEDIRDTMHAAVFSPFGH